MANHDELLAAAAPELGEYLSKLPSFGIGISTANTDHNMNGGQAGISLVNVRGLGITSTLVMFNCHRVAASTLVGVVVGGLYDPYGRVFRGGLRVKLYFTVPEHLKINRLSGSPGGRFFLADDHPTTTVGRAPA